jgi:hypothetical protein
MTLTNKQTVSIQAYAACDPSPAMDPRVETLVHELIGRVASKWTMIVLWSARYFVPVGLLV